MDKLFIIHYLPIDYYPPALNLINALEDKAIIKVSSMRKSNPLPEYDSKVSKIYRIIKENKRDSSLKVLVKYLWFCFYTLLKLIQTKPNVVFYYESNSALPAYLYKHYINNDVKLCIHYHEYLTPFDYSLPGRRLLKYNHILETSYLYQVACWISQTNEYRRNLFLKDYPNIIKNVCYILPNYPPKNWLSERKEHNGEVVKCVYVGSLSLQTTFVLEFCKWINQQQGRVTFDIYSFNFHKDTLEAVEKLHSPYIHFHKEGVKYSEIPNLLDRYDVGVLLYKAKTLNFKYNETNKFYEYLICGLDVWYPKEMTLLHEMDKSVFAPEIVEMDITNGKFPELNMNRRIVDNSSYNRMCEDVYDGFWK